MGQTGKTWHYFLNIQKNHFINGIKTSCEHRKNRKQKNAIYLRVTIREKLDILV